MANDASGIRLDDLIRLVTQLHPEDNALEQLTGAVALAARMNELSDHLVGHFVDEARKAGATWADIGSSLGVSKQAAQKRFVPGDVSGDLGRFTYRAQRVIIVAQEEARSARHQQVCTEHLVLGLLSEPGALATQALLEQGITAEQVRAAMTVLLPPAIAAVPDQIPFSPQARKVLDLTVREALRLGHNYVGTEHLLLGILTDSEGAGARALTRLGLDRGNAEEWMLDKIGDLAHQRPEPRRAPPTPR